jgi:hypothetical protein
MDLQKFKSDDILFSDKECWQILVFFFGGNSGISVNSLTDNDKSFAQAILIQVIDLSYSMGWIECLFKETMKLEPSIKGIVKALAKKSVKDWWKKTPLDKIEGQEIYLSVKNDLTRKWHTSWSMRLSTDEDVY